MSSILDTTNTNFLDPCLGAPAPVPGLRPSTVSRVNKAQGLFVPDKFSPVSAVPNEIDNVNISEATEAPVKLVVTTNFVQEARVASSVKQENNFILQTDERRRFKKCHGRCVQKFCLPVGILSVFEACTEKCKGICPQ